METLKVKKAVAEAKRFLAAAKDWEDREFIEKVFQKEHDTRCYTTKEGGALRRASLDLTRALAEMRKA